MTNRILTQPPIKPGASYTYERPIEKVDVDHFMILNDGLHGYTLNNKGFPATEPIVAKLGQKVRIRFMNEGRRSIVTTLIVET